MKFLLPLIQFQEDQVFFVYSPSLDLTGYGYTPEEAASSFQETLDFFIEHTTRNQNLEKELQRLGWKVLLHDGQKEITPPSLEGLLTHNKNISEILNKQLIKGQISKIETFNQETLAPTF